MAFFWGGGGGGRCTAYTFVIRGLDNTNDINDRNYSRNTLGSFAVCQPALTLFCGDNIFSSCLLTCISCVNCVMYHISVSDSLLDITCCIICHIMPIKFSCLWAFKFNVSDPCAFVYLSTSF